MSKLFVLDIDIWIYTCLLRIKIISYFKPYNCVQTNDYYKIKIGNWKYIIV